jgi:hypothetical protein
MDSAIKVLRTHFLHRTLHVLAGSVGVAHELFVGQTPARHSRREEPPRGFDRSIMERNIVTIFEAKGLFLAEKSLLRCGNQQLAFS